MSIYRGGKSPYLMAAVMLLTLLAVLVKSFIPAGFMPESGAGYTKLVICSGLGEKTILIPSGDEDPAPHDNRNDMCAYQILSAHKGVGAPDAALIDAPAIITAVDYDQERAKSLPLHALSSLFARGPPVV
jgi:hypothetical protein